MQASLSLAAFRNEQECPLTHAHVAPSRLVGMKAGMNAGTSVGTNVGINVGTDVGINVGKNVATNEGVDVGINVGINVGTNVGTNVGINVDAIATQINGYRELSWGAVVRRSLPLSSPVPLSPFPSPLT